MTKQTIHLPFDVQLLPAKILKAGNLECMYEKGNLRYIKSNGTEVVRMIYSAIRNSNWETAPYEISDEVIEENEEGFIIRYTALYNLDDIRYRAAFYIEAKNDVISFSMKGIALSTFQTNRIGICIHNPIKECAGKKVIITQPDGSSYEGVFPKDISPHQPFRQIQQMQWSMADGLEAQLSFEGDVFETEDQRNWTDASYKTYSRPLSLPFPYAINEGETIEQKVTLKVTGNKDVSSKTTSIPPSATETKVPFPKVGYSRPKGSKLLTSTQINLLKKVPFNHYRVELHMDEAGWERELDTALTEAKHLETKLELIVFFSGNNETELQALLPKLQNESNLISSVLALQKNQKGTPQQLLEDVYEAFKNALPHVQIGYGTDGFFAELNRNRPTSSTFDFVSYTINPQVHAADTRSIIENLDAQADTIKTGQSFIKGKAIHVSPVTLKIRSNSAKDVDERLHTNFSAWWTLQTIKNLSGAGSITFYETVGPKGIIKEDASYSAVAEQSSEALLTPLYKMLAAIKAFDPRYLIITDEHQLSFVVEHNAGDRLTFTTEEDAVSNTFGSH